MPLSRLPQPSPRLDSHLKRQDPAQQFQNHPVPFQREHSLPPVAFSLQTNCLAVRPRDRLSEPTGVHKNSCRTRNRAALAPSCRGQIRSLLRPLSRPQRPWQQRRLQQLLGCRTTTSPRRPGLDRRFSPRSRCRRQLRHVKWHG